MRWVKAMTLNTWAGRQTARGNLSLVLRRLIRATLNDVRRFTFPAGESTDLGGWDGIVETPLGNAFVPVGTSGWELSTQKSINKKANDDYDKRKQEPHGLEPGQTTFVFVTPRRWHDKQAWATEKNKEGFWADVRAYDADDLELWIEQAPAVGSWVGSLIGSRPAGVKDTERVWDNWAFQTDPPMSREFVLAGRKEFVTVVQNWLDGDPAVLGVHGETVEEVAASFAAVLLELPEEKRTKHLSRCLVVTESSSWPELLDSHDPLILVPTFSTLASLVPVIRRPRNRDVSTVASRFPSRP